MKVANLRVGTRIVISAFSMLVLVIAMTGCSTLRDARRSRPTGAEGTTYTREAEIDGYSRRWQFYIPPGTGSDPLPLLIALPVAASMPTDQMPRCNPARPISVMMINGTDDPLVPYGGGVVASQLGERGTVESVSDTIGFWRAADSCTQGPGVDPIPDGPQDDGSSVDLFTWSGCADSAAVELYRIDGGGHTWPSGPQYLPAIVVGETNRDFNATEEIWEFFTAHPIVDGRS